MSALTHFEGISLKALHQLVIRNGMILDGSGAPPFEADVAVEDGQVVAIGGVAGKGEEEIDARGMHVTPGFVDIHTHYDGQAVWDERMLPSSGHGVTTALMGNCGVGFAPVKPTDRGHLIELMEGVEDIPGVALDLGLNWDWQSFPEYLGVLSRGNRDIDICAQLAHAPLRLYVMGERALRGETATADDISSMRKLTCEAMKAGALGFSTSRTINHRSANGDPIPSLRASPQELLGIALGMRDAGAGVLELISDWNAPDLQTEFAMLEELARESGRPLSFSLGQSHASPQAWRELMDHARAASARGVTMLGQVAPRPIGLLLGLQGSLNPFSDYPSYMAIAKLSLADRLSIMSSADFRARLLSESSLDEAVPIARRLRAFEYMFPLGDPPNYEPQRDSSVAHEASRRGCTAAALAYDLLLQDSGRNFLFVPIINYADFSLDVCREMMVDALTIPGLGDGGAHVSIISDASFPTFSLAYWGRDRTRGRIPLESIVRRQSYDCARFIGLHDRGLVRVGYKADLNVIDMDAIALERPFMVSDLPGGANRLLQKARGYRATVVSGFVTYQEGEPRKALPGQVVRGAKPSPAGATRPP